MVHSGSGWPRWLACDACYRRRKQRHTARFSTCSTSGEKLSRAYKLPRAALSLPDSRAGWQRLPTMITLTALRGYEGAYAELVPVIESRPGVEPSAEDLHGLMLQRLGTYY